jgi:Zn-dependent protease with chaperone function
MFSKPLSLVLVYILTIFNFLILTLPFLAAVFPFMYIEGNNIVLAKYISFNPKLALLSMVFMISFLMLCYLFIDFIFGFSIRLSLKDCKPYDKAGNYGFLQEIFEEVKSKFSNPSAKLYIKNSDEINAFAVGGMGRKIIVLTSGLIEHYASNTESDQQFLFSLRSILGHEMSHLINKDFLPGLLIIINQRVTNFISSILMMIFKIALQLGTYFRIQNKRAALMMLTIYNICDWILNFFNRYIINGLYNFLRNFLGRAVEYRCDRQSAKAFGGINMAFALSLLGKSGYFTLFSTHPATIKRIKKVEVIEEKNAIIRASLLSKISNFSSIMILPAICFYTAHLSEADEVIKLYIYYNYPDIYYDAAKAINIAENLLAIAKQLILKLSNR